MPMLDRPATTSRTRAGRRTPARPAAVTSWHPPTSSKAPVMIHRSVPAWPAITLIVVPTGPSEGGWTAPATIQPPVAKTGDRAAETTVHHGTGWRGGLGHAAELARGRTGRREGRASGSARGLDAILPTYPAIADRPPRDRTRTGTHRAGVLAGQGTGQGLGAPGYLKQAAATAAWKSRRRALTAVASRPKCTELVSSTAQTPLGESSARLVPVKPVCDTAEAGQEPPRMSKRSPPRTQPSPRLPPRPAVSADSAFRRSAART